MRRQFINRYAKAGTKPAILRDVYRFLTADCSAAETSEQGEVDNRIAEFILNADDPNLFFDLRKLNGRPKDIELNPFWEALGSYLDGIGVVQERRQNDKLYMPIDMSVDSLIRTVAEKLPEGSRVPSRSWVSFNFWPSNPFIRSALCYTGRFNVKYSVQQRLARAKHPDANFAFHQFKMLKDMAVKYQDSSCMICLDDKSMVSIGEPGCPVSTGVRPHNKALIPVNAKLYALDHDFHVHGAIPSVLFNVNIPDNRDDSFYQGTIHVTVKDKVFSPSVAVRHATETILILRDIMSSDGVSLDKPRLFIFTDGGQDHRSTYWSVKLSYIAIFIALDVDILIAARTAPSQSYANPAERCMSILNLALQNTALEREKDG